MPSLARSVRSESSTERIGNHRSWTVSVLAEQQHFALTTPAFNDRFHSDGRTSSPTS